MKTIFLFIATLMFSSVITYGQQNFCADSSVRIRYIFGNEGATLFKSPDTSEKNIFTGYFKEGTNTGIALLKTDWGDSMLWARKIFLNGKSLNTVTAPDGSIICSGYWGTGSNLDLLVTRLNTTGTVLWAKRFRLTSNHQRYIAFDQLIRNVIVTQNSIYVRGTFYNTSVLGYNVIFKLDLNGNILWSKSFMMNAPAVAPLIHEPIIDNDTLIFAANYMQQSGSTFLNFLTVLTRIDNNNGALMVTNAIRITSTDTIGCNNTHFNINPDNTFSLSGNFITKLPFGIGFTNIVFNTLIDKNFTPVHIYYYEKNVDYTPGDLHFDNNKRRQHALLVTESNDFRNKYLVTFDENNQPLRTRKFILPSSFSSIYQTMVNLDDKQNMHFVFHYPQGSQLVTEYARISDFAPSGTPGCFGKDTSILTPYSLSLAKEPFTWDNIYSDLITGIDVPFVEDTAIVTKELVCKMVSYCDSVHITGPATACTNQPVRYSVSKNSQCLKSLQWNIDTTIATIVNTEADTAITLSFKQAFTGYIHATVYNCVVSDSFFVTVAAPKTLQFVNRDSLLCPGKSIVLKAMSGFNNYLWQDGSIADSFRVTTPGFYKVSGTDNCGLQTADSINIKYTDTSLTIPAAQTVCLNDTAYIILPNDVSNITWQPASNSLLNNKTLLLFPKQNTLYNITAERSVNCPILRTTSVDIKICTELVFIPNAFTPNNDGVNDSFKASTFRPLQSYQLVIYNRYGQKLFETNDLSAGWDGTFKGKPQPTGGFTYHCSYRFTGGLQRSESGYFILIR